MKIGAKAPRVPITGNRSACEALALWFLLNRAKSGILTAKLEKSPMMMLSVCKAENARPTAGFILSGPVTSGPPSLVTITA